MLNEKHVIKFQSLELILVLFVVLLSVSTTAYGHMHNDSRWLIGRTHPGHMGMHDQFAGGHGMGMMGSYVMAIMNVPDMSREQRSKLRSLMREQRKDNINTVTEIMDVRDELADVMNDDPVDADKADKLYAKLFEKQRLMLSNSIKLRNKMYSTLSQEQKEWLQKNAGKYHMMDDRYMMQPSRYMDD